MNEAQNIKNTLDMLKAYSSTASKIYNLFKQSKLSSANPTLDEWKIFEEKMVRLMYSGLGEDNPPAEVCNLTALLNSFALSIATVASLEAQLEKVRGQLSSTSEENING